MEDFVSFETSKKLKEKGFPQSPDYFNHSSYYEWDGLRKIHPLTNASVWFDQNISRDNLYFAPTISQVLEWLRNEKKLYVEPCILADTDAESFLIFNKYSYWNFAITHIETGEMLYFEKYEHTDFKRYDSYEQAALAGIEYTLNNLKFFNSRILV